MPLCRRARNTAVAPDDCRPVSIVHPAYRLWAKAPSQLFFIIPLRFGVVLLQSTLYYKVKWVLASYGVFSSWMAAGAAEPERSDWQEINMDADRAASELKVIRQLMERPVRYSTMSGLSGILAGLVTLGGLEADAMVCARYGEHTKTMLLNLVVWACVFLVALAGTLGLTRLRELRQGMPFWSPIKTRILKTILPLFVGGAGLTAAIMYRWYMEVGPNQFGLIPAIWMISYGIACWQVGEFSIREMRIMGAAFVLAGLATAAFFQFTIPCLGHPGQAPYWTLGITFGGFHILYGLAVWIRHGG
jgi:hypothetical protein